MAKAAALNMGRKSFYNQRYVEYGDLGAL